MDKIPLKVKRLRPEAVLPRYMTEHAAGMDLHAAIEAAISLSPGERQLIPTGLAFGIPLGYEGQVRPRSGLALKKGIALVNAPGTIDADYRGEVGIILINHGAEEVRIEPGDRIAQMIIAPVSRAEIADVEELDETVRSDGGFGHTGSNQADRR